MYACFFTSSKFYLKSGIIFQKTFCCILLEDFKLFSGGLASGLTLLLASLVGEA